MKKSILLTFAMVCLLVTGYSQTDTIWGGANDPNSRFALGLNDWTAMAGTSSTYNVPPDCASNRTPVSTEADPDALWAWDENGMAEEGAFWGSRGPIASPSLADGAAIFNSSFLDNAGSDTNCGGGIAPSPHTGYLVSPTFSCAGHSTVFVRFHQYFRNFVATTTLDVSIDGGTTWVRDTLNGNLQFNDETGNDDVQLVNISAIAANQPNVMIRFTFEGEYYFWIIDDVIGSIAAMQSVGGRRSAFRECTANGAGFQLIACGIADAPVAVVAALEAASNPALARALTRRAAVAVGPDLPAPELA